MRAFLIFVLFSAPALAQEGCSNWQEQARTKYRAAVECAITQARDLSKSGSNPTDVATASMVGCKMALDGLSAVIDACRPFETAQSLRSTFWSGIRDEAIAAVVRERVRR